MNTSIDKWGMKKGGVRRRATLVGSVPSMVMEQQLRGYKSKMWANSFWKENPKFSVDAKPPSWIESSGEWKYVAVSGDLCICCRPEINWSKARAHLKSLKHYVLWCRWNRDEAVKRFPSSRLALMSDVILGIIEP